MRAETDKAKIEAFMVALGNRVRGGGAVYLTVGATAVWYQWRAMTIDVDIKPDPEPAGLFESIARLKDELDIKVELASPDLFIPAVPGWRERIIFIARHGRIEWFHYDLYGQALSKIQRRHERDVRDVRAMLERGMISTEGLWEMFARIEPQMIRYPAIDAPTFRAAVEEFCHAKP